MINPLKVISGTKNSVKKTLSIEEYLAKHRISEDAIEIVDQKNNIIDEFLDRHGIDEDALRTVEGRKGVLLKHRLLSRTILLYTLTAPMVIIPFWLMWALSPGNFKGYSERMQFALLGVLSMDVLGLCTIVTRDLYPNGKHCSKEIDDSEKETMEDE